jgi:acyl-CoA thioesterase-2
VPASLTEVIGLLDLEELEVGLYRGRQPGHTFLPRAYGGQVAAQGVMAAQRTVPDDRIIHSLHAYFLLGGDPHAPIIYDVEMVRDGGSFTTRRVAARQAGKVIFYMTASFQRFEKGFEHQDRMPAVPGPDDCAKLGDLIERLRPDQIDGWRREWSSFDLRYVGDNRDGSDANRTLTPVVQRLWFRADGDLPNDDRVHNAAFTYISDFSLLSAALLPHGVYIGDPSLMVASLDHAIWFHRPIRADQWLLYDQASPSASGARGLSTAHVFSQDGTLVATVAQEGLIRPVTVP